MKIVVCSLAINEWYREIVKYAIKNFESYCKKNNYEFVLHTEYDTDIIDNTRSPCWFKIKLIDKILKTKNCDYIVWIDADCQILKNDIKLEYFIQKYIYNDYKLALTIDNNILNTGIMFIKNEEFNINLMKKIWEYPVDDYFKDFHEQTVLATLYSSDEQIKKYINIIPYGVKDELVVYWGNYYPGQHFLLHAARCSYDRLSFMYMMDAWYPYKLDEENIEEYNDRMLWLNNKDICRSDLDNCDKMVRRYSARCIKYFNIFFNK